MIGKKEREERQGERRERSNKDKEVRPKDRENIQTDIKT